MRDLQVFLDNVALAAIFSDAICCYHEKVSEDQLRTWLNGAEQALVSAKLNFSHKRKVKPCNRPKRKSFGSF